MYKFAPSPIAKCSRESRVPAFVVNSKRFCLYRVGQGINKTATKPETHDGTPNFFFRCVIITLCTKR